MFNFMIGSQTYIIVKITHGNWKNLIPSSITHEEETKCEYNNRDEGWRFIEESSYRAGVLC